ncbi:DUF5709 domain-containing protein [Streptomyces tanashiensis]|jgi:hypothetical protein|uniref:DUF5709 domain-containing protein n=1 Tax=Streptomyces tanashiensis TaxID=67367 RepID=A0ABY6QP30_9ACTN|nr:DUF5709 domain-containing protein [Streptomyces tanashiensis]UZX19558.1 DUF5709 domain-containing protein [Streptomyces tanashiensis]GGY17842.1 hypothetical protein GCM10010299_24020 [Streptomyces tanashiensis]
MTGAETWGDDVYQPDGSEVQDDVGVLDYEDTLEGPPGDPLDEGYSPPERPLGAEHTGVTAAERQRGETLDERLAEEEPELPPLDGDGLGDSTDTDGELLDDQVGSRRAGRLMSEDEGTRSITSELNARDLGLDGGAASAEEAAMHIVDEE